MSTPNTFVVKNSCSNVLDIPKADVCVVDEAEFLPSTIDDQKKSLDIGVEMSVETVTSDNISLVKIEDPVRNTENRDKETEEATQILEGGSAEDSDLEDVVINRVRAVTVKAPVCVMGQPVGAVVDTGAEVTVISHKFYERIPAEKRPVMKSVDRCLVNAEDGKKMKTPGMISTTVEIGDMCFDWPVYVAPIGDDMLLGCDILDEKNITVNTKRGLEVNGKWIECDVLRKMDSVARVTLRRSVTVPANSEFVVTGKADKPEVFNSRYAALEPVTEDKRRVMIAHSLVDVKGKGIPVRIVNVSKSPVKLAKGYLLGELHEIEDIEDSTDETENEDIHICRAHLKTEEVFKQQNLDEKVDATIDVGLSLPEHLQDLYRRSTENISDDTQKKKLAEVLLKHSDAFAKDKLEPGLKCPSVMRTGLESVVQQDCDAVDNEMGFHVDVVCRSPNIEMDTLWDPGGILSFV